MGITCSKWTIATTSVTGLGPCIRKHPVILKEQSYTRLLHTAAGKMGDIRSPGLYSFISKKQVSRSEQ